MFPTTPAVRPDAAQIVQAAHRVRENLTSGLERAAVADLLEVLGLARVDLPIQVVGTYDRAVELLAVPGRPVWCFTVDTIRPLHGSPDTR